MNRLLDLLNWVIRLKQKGEGHDVSKSKEKFKWYSVFLEFIQNTIDSNIKLNQELKKSNQNHKDLPAVIKISFTKIIGSLTRYISFLDKTFCKWFFVATVGVVIISTFLITVFQNNFLKMFNLGSPEILNTIFDLKLNK